MAEDGRRYSGAQDWELHDLIKEYRKRIKGFEHEQAMIGPANAHTEAWQAEERNIEGDRAYIAEIRAELDRRKTERARTLDQALRTWSESTATELPQSVFVNWNVDGRQYSGRFFFDSGRLDVSLPVPAGTPNARQRGNRHYLPCTTAEQHETARRATQERPSSPPR